MMLPAPEASSDSLSWFDVAPSVKRKTPANGCRSASSAPRLAFKRPWS
jgi:hypothetical protein